MIAGLNMENMLRVMHEHKAFCEAHGNELKYIEQRESTGPGDSGYHLVCDDCDCSVDLFVFVESHAPGSIVDRSNPNPPPGHCEVDATTKIESDKITITGNVTHGAKP